MLLFKLLISKYCSVQIISKWCLQFATSAQKKKTPLSYNLWSILNCLTNWPFMAAWFPICQYNLDMSWQGALFFFYPPISKNRKWRLRFKSKTTGLQVLTVSGVSPLNSSRCMEMNQSLQVQQVRRKVCLCVYYWGLRIVSWESYDSPRFRSEVLN